MSLAVPVANLRHLYAIMIAGQVSDTAEAARGLLGPCIALIERHMMVEVAEIAAELSPNTSPNVSGAGVEMVSSVAAYELAKMHLVWTRANLNARRNKVARLNKKLTYALASLNEAEVIMSDELADQANEDAGK